MCCRASMCCVAAPARYRAAARAMLQHQHRPTPVHTWRELRSPATVPVSVCRAWLARASRDERGASRGTCTVLKEAMTPGWPASVACFSAIHGGLRHPWTPCEAVSEYRSHLGAVLHSGLSSGGRPPPTKSARSRRSSAAASWCPRLALPCASACVCALLARSCTTRVGPAGRRLGAFPGA